MRFNFPPHRLFLNTSVLVYHKTGRYIPGANNVNILFGMFWRRVKTTPISTVDHSRHNLTEKTHIEAQEDNELNFS
jgi:uncharacterized protein YueI